MPKTEDSLDVRKIPPPKKHSTILGTYEALERGQTFIIINDHDPKPLRFQFVALYGEENLLWEYLEEGPEVWKVRIGKPSNKN